MSAPGNTDVVRSVGKRRFRLSGTFFPNGSSPIVAASNIGTAGWTVAYTSTGLYTVTLNDPWLKLTAKNLAFAQTIATAVFPQWGLIDVSGAKTLQIRSINGSGVLTDISAAAGNSISFDLELTTDSVQK